MAKMPGFTRDMSSSARKDAVTVNANMECFDMRNFQRTNIW